MRLPSPRIKPLRNDELTDEQAEALRPLGSISNLNIFCTLARIPKALSCFNEWANYFWQGPGTPQKRAREIVILRTGFLCKCGYEWTQHVDDALREGLTKEDVTRIKQGPGAGWSLADAVLIQATDELHRDHFVSDRTWAELRKHYSEADCMDMVLTAGQYTQVSMFLNTFGVQLEPGQKLDPDLNAC
ncbi:carboxymuconolactone decarboxylase family protein [Bradyrhizobium yuanmingense]|uniref:carboxymuconolactone decarboxylase family protein n=1 Tax=Bradyrhizobium yuanmingense TaxID=108015 RepID=UPI0023B8B52F|nr:carboxymuconolactone decarboxylase family protein [Bradyrhizobium yuanmingense]MDF0498625.1 carboxymuconolactone decarboxylase family protein [Bradyrhizobium yuanmingense]